MADRTIDGLLFWAALLAAPAYMAGVAGIAAFDNIAGVARCEAVTGPNFYGVTVTRIDCYGPTGLTRLASYR